MQIYSSKQKWSQSAAKTGIWIEGSAEEWVAFINQRDNETKAYQASIMRRDKNAASMLRNIRYPLLIHK